jgi:Na+/H+-dicarboxylate symporter
MKKLALHWKIIIGMVLGILFALLMIQFSFGKSFISDWVKPFGDIFINVLKLIAVPLILASLIKGVSDLKDVSKLSLMGGRTIGLYLMTTVLAVSIGLVIVNIVQPGKSISEKTRNELTSSFESEANSKIAAAADQQTKGPLQPLLDIVPSNIFDAASDNGNMLQVIFFAIFFGIAMILIPEAQSTPVKAFFDGVNDVILKMIDLIMLFAPYGVFALLAALVAEAPSPDLFFALAWYAFSVVLGLAIMIGFYALIVYLTTKKTPRFFINETNTDLSFDTDLDIFTEKSL